MPHQPPPEEPLPKLSPEERLARFDELTPGELARLERDPASAGALALLQALDQELLLHSPAELPCPSAEDLYSFGNGPGAPPLDLATRSRVGRHIEDCIPCRRLVETLRSAPPPPLIAGPLIPKDISREQAALLRWAPAVAAAAVLILVGSQMLPDELEQRWPVQETLRGTSSDALLFPRGRVLAGALGSWASAPLFELDLPATAERVTIQVRRDDGSAFGEGALLEVIMGVRGQSLVGKSLRPGSYSFEALIEESGLSRSLGRRSFQVVEDMEIQRGLASRQGVAAIAFLHEAGYLTDARGLARRQPESPERSAYLAARPGR